MLQVMIAWVQLTQLKHRVLAELSRVCYPGCPVISEASHLRNGSEICLRTCWVQQTQPQPQ